MRSLFRRLSVRVEPAPAPLSFEEQLEAKVADVVAKWQEAVRIASTQAYITGHAAGELAGRQALAHELMVAHGTGDGGEKPMTADELATLKIRQVH